MPEIIRWSFSVNVAQGPSVSASDSVRVDAYDRLSIPLPAGAKDVEVELQPAKTAKQVSLLVVRASTPAADVTLTADGGTPHPLDGPFVLIGSGAVQLLADALQTLRLSNGTAADVTVDILVGRDPTP
ncbi:hypothetical protein AB0D34_06430 [Streptomyces sp. NPDC048420]|uniref:hypothetical protein n=1 Tax=Streptomyces sp. NPDC048420 TaxID=3155755 RepID=UPI00341B7D9C